MKFFAVWIHLLSLVQVRVLGQINSPNAGHNHEAIFNLYGNGHTISESPYRQSSVMFENQCLAHCVFDYLCISFEVAVKTIGGFECSLFNVSYQLTNGLIQKNNAKYYSKFFYSKDCTSWHKAGKRKTEVYDTWFLGKYLQVFCNMEEDGGGWMVFQRRFDGSVSFDRTWDKYKNRFGNIDGEFWLGNKWLHLITNSQDENYDLFVTVESFKGITKRKKFHGFKIGSEEEKFKFDYESVSNGYATERLFEEAKDNVFSTKDSIGPNCAKEYKAGWWFLGCHQDLMNGEYPKTNDGSTNAYHGIHWRQWNEADSISISRKKSQLMIRPSNFKSHMN